MLRIDINILWTVINVLILYFLMKKFLFGRVHKILDQREQDIQAQRQKAADTNAEAEKLKAQYEAQMQTIEAQGQKSIAEAKEKADAEYNRILAEAGQKSDGIVAAARERAKAAAQEEKRAAAKEIADMVKEAAQTQAAAVDDNELYDTFLKETAASGKGETQK